MATLGASRCRDAGGRVKGTSLPGQRHHDKLLGAYYTPPEVVAALVAWAGPSSNGAGVLDPSCGDGRFLVGLSNATGVDVDPAAAQASRRQARTASVVNADFFEWALATESRFGAAIGNPPFIRYQSFGGEVRARALELCRRQGVQFRELTSSWAPFIVGSSGLLRRGGRIAFVVPAEISYAVYARPLLKYLLSKFGRVEVIAIREKLFPHLSEDCWLLRARDFGASARALHFAKLLRFDPAESSWEFESVPTSELERLDFRLRSLLLPSLVRAAYSRLRSRTGVTALGSIATIGIGYVTGANDFFHVRPSQAKSLGLPRRSLRVAVRSNRDLESHDIDQGVVEGWLKQDRPVLLLDLSQSQPPPPNVRAYFKSDAGKRAQEAYKCRSRKPWYAVPGVRSPDAFLSLMSHSTPRMVGNSARAVCTNSVHAVQFYEGVDVREVIRRWENPLTALSCEVEGHALGGGMLKLEPTEARRVVVPLALDLPPRTAAQLERGVLEMREWRGTSARRGA